MVHIPKNTIVRIMREQVDNKIQEEAKDSLTREATAYIKTITKEAAELARHSNRKTIMLKDVELAIINYNK